MVPGDEARDAFPVTPYGCNRGESALSSDWSVSSLARALLSKLQAVGHDFRETQPMNMKISHGGVCILITGVILSCDPLAYVRPSPQKTGPTPTWRELWLNSGIFKPAIEMLS